MSFLEHHGPVRYACTCGELKPISRIFFCRHCSKIRCGFCVCHEVDARYCAVCVDNIPAAEAWMKGNCCTRCFTCPLCDHNLMIRITASHSKNKEKSDESEKDESKTGEKAEPPKKFYYLNCFFCHWTSRDIGVPDQTTSSGNWPESENPQSGRINALIEYYKAVSINDKLLKEKKQPSPRRAYSHLSGMTASVALRKAGLSSFAATTLGFSSLQDLRKVPEITPAVPSDDTNDLPEEIFTATPDLSKVTTLEQRLRVPYLQCEDTSKLKLCRSLLLTKRSQRCRECEHNVTKPEFNPGSIKFKIQLSAYFHIPDMHIKSCDPLLPGKESNLVIKISNPTPHPTTIKLLPLEESDLFPPIVPGDGKGSGETEAKDVSLPVSKRSPFMKVDPRAINVNLTATPFLPTTSIVLPGRDDAAEYDDTCENPSFNEDKQFIVWKKGNRAAIKLSVCPKEDLQPGEEVNLGFIMSHTYINTIIQEKDQQKIVHDAKVIITPGKIAS